MEFHLNVRLIRLALILLII